MFNLIYLYKISVKTKIVFSKVKKFLIVKENRTLTTTDKILKNQNHTHTLPNDYNFVVL